MSKKIQIKHQYSGRMVDVPPSCQRLCAQCYEPMTLDHYVWVGQYEVQIMWLCSHPGTSRFKRVVANMDRKGRLK